MKFILISLFALGSVALAIRQEEHSNVNKRQADVASNVPVNVAAMTDKDGNVVLFDSNGVYLDSVAKGL